MCKALFIFICHDIRVTLRQAFSWTTPLLFFIMAVCLFPLALGPDPIFLSKMAPSIIWVAALLAILLSVGHLFRQDAEEGFLDSLLLSPWSLTMLVVCKVVSHWITHCLPLVLISPLLGFLLYLPSREIAVLVMTLLPGTFTLSMLGAIGAGLTAGLRSSGLLLPLLIMPLYVPVLIFGAGAIVTGAFHVCLALLCAFMLLTMAFAPLLTGVALRTGANQ